MTTTPATPSKVSEVPKRTASTPTSTARVADDARFLTMTSEYLPWHGDHGLRRCEGRLACVVLGGGGPGGVVRRSEAGGAYYLYAKETLRP